MAAGVRDANPPHAKSQRAIGRHVAHQARVTIETSRTARRAEN
jgi:hypothetical protein